MKDYKPFMFGAFAGASASAIGVCIGLPWPICILAAMIAGGIVGLFMPLRGDR